MPKKQATTTKKAPADAGAFTLSGAAVRRLRDELELSAAACARIVGMADGSNWRRWERDGVKGMPAVLLSAMIELPALRNHLTRTK